MLANNNTAFIGSTITECQIEGNWFTGGVIITNNSTGYFSRNGYQGSWSNTFASVITNAIDVCGNRSTSVAGDNDGITCTGTNITGTFTGNGSGLTNVSISGTQSIAQLNVTNVAYATNLSGTSPNFQGGMRQTLTTNNAFVWLAPSGINIYKTNVQRITITVTNAAAAVTNMTPPANVYTKGTWNVTNITYVDWEYDPSINSTSAFSYPFR